MDRSLTLAEELIAISPEMLDDADYEQLRRLLLDALGIAVAGSNRRVVAALSKWAERFAGSGRALVAGHGYLTAPSVAAFVNGTAIHSHELDDTHDASMSHPGAVVIPAALAVGAEVGASGRQVLAAIVAGYEAMGRIGAAANANNVLHGGYHPTALFGGFGAGTAAAKLLGLDTRGLLVTWGHVLSLAGGSMQFSDETEGTSVKRVHAGYAAQNGIMAAELAQAGVDAPHRPIDGKYGFLALYGRNPIPRLLDGGRSKVIHQISMKPYACCRLFHSMIDGLRSVTDGFSKPLESIRSVQIGGHGVLRDQHMMKRPASSMAAQYSLPYVVGATLEYGPGAFDAYDEHNLTNDRILRWGDVVSCHIDDAVEREFPAHFGTSVEVLYADGTCRKDMVLDSLGTPPNPMASSGIRDKVSGLARQCQILLDVAALEAAVGSLAAEKSVSKLQEALTLAGR